MSDKRRFRVTERLIQEINSKLDLREILSYYGVKSKGDLYYCPWCQARPHHKHKPNLVINEDHTWQCLASCGSGTPLEFIQKFDDIAPDAALMLAAAIAEISFEEEEEDDDQQLSFSFFSDDDMFH